MSSNDVCKPIPVDSPEYRALLERITYPLPKPTKNPTEEFKQVEGKICTTLVPSSIIWAIGKIRTHFTKIVGKYPDPQSWRKAPMQHYVEAADRHWLIAREDPKAINPESGMPHLWHAATNIAFIIEMLTNEEKEHEERRNTD